MVRVMRTARLAVMVGLMVVGAGACRLPEVPWGPPPPGIVCHKGDFSKCNPKHFAQPDCPRCNSRNAGY
jgi:hypothetical protein